MQNSFKSPRVLSSATGVKLLGVGMIDSSPLLTEQTPLAEAERAFQLAGDRKHALKVSPIQ
jgi:L-idonate 5-dehydrogenase